MSEPDPPAGAIERILSDLGVADGELLDWGMALDKAAAQLFAEAAALTAPQRWRPAVARPSATTNASAITRHVLAADQIGWTVKIQSLHAPADRSLDSQAEPLQAEI